MVFRNAIIITGLVFLFSCKSSGGADVTGENSARLSKNTGPDTFIVIGSYTHRVTSMCSQSCENFDLGPYRLTEHPSNIERFVRGRQVKATGLKVKVEELPTIAGPNATETDEHITVTRFKALDVKKIDFAVINKENGKLNVKIINPLDEEIKVAVRVDHLVKKLSLAPKATGTVRFNEYQSFSRVHITDSEYNPENSSNSLRQLEEKGLVIWLKEAIR